MARRVPLIITGHAISVGGTREDFDECSLNTYPLPGPDFAYLEIRIIPNAYGSSSTKQVDEQICQLAEQVSTVRRMQIEITAARKCHFSLIPFTNKVRRLMIVNAHDLVLPDKEPDFFASLGSLKVLTEVHSGRERRLHETLSESIWLGLKSKQCRLRSLYADGFSSDTRTLLSGNTSLRRVTLNESCRPWGVREHPALEQANVITAANNVFATRESRARGVYRAHLRHLLQNVARDLKHCQCNADSLLHRSRFPYDLFKYVLWPMIEATLRAPMIPLIA